MSKDGGAAFPQTGYGSGMTLRDYFAAAALPAFLDGNSVVAMNELAKERKTTAHGEVAQACYGIADAMIKEREK